MLVIDACTRSQTIATAVVSVFGPHAGFVKPDDVWTGNHPNNLSALVVNCANPQTVFLQHESWLRTVVRSRLREPEAVEDVMQNIAMAIVKQNQALQEVNRLGAWLYQVAIRQVLMYRRAKGRKRKLHGRLLEGFAVPIQHDSCATPEQHVIAAETQQNVRLAMDELNELDRQILMLKYSEDWSYRQLAELLGVKEDTVEYRLTKARKNMRRSLLRLGEGGTAQP